MSGVLRLSDVDGDVLTVRSSRNGQNLWVGDRCLLDRAGVRVLRDHLDAFLGDSEGDTAPDTEPLAEWERELMTAAEPTVLEDAQAAVYGDRQQDYGHPREDFTRTAILWTGLLHHKLADGHHLEPEDIARCMIAVKLARDVHSPKRDNRVDMAGYALTLDRLETGL